MYLSINTICFGQNINNIEHKNLDAYIEHLMERQGIPGLALAIKKGDQIIYRKNFGFANLEHQVPVTNKSIFRLYSLTKPVISVGIFQLIEDGLISMDDFVSEYVSDLPKSWRIIQIKHLLSHSSGLPDMAPIPEFQDLSEEEAKAKIFAQEMKFKPGERYDYNQTGFWLLQKIIEKTTKKNLSTFILNNQFKESKNTFFSSDSRDIVINRVTPYFPFAKGTLMIDHSYLKGTYAYAKNGLNITMDELIEWDHSLSSNSLLSEVTKDLMWQEHPYINSNQRFTYGWDKIVLNGHDSYGFSGSLCTAYRVFPDEQISIFFLSNGLSRWYNIDNIVNHIASLVDKELVDINNLGFESILRSSFEHEYPDFIERYKEIKKHPLLVKNNFEIHLNDVGYFWLRVLNDPSKALEIFEFNTVEHPHSWNTFDSLAETYERMGNFDKAIENYRTAINLNPDQEYKQSIASRISKLTE